MRLSEKGCVHLNEWMVHKLPIDAFVFKPEDFTGAVVLTVEEAKLIQKLLRHCYFTTDIKEIEELVLVQDGILKERIEQAEKCDAND